MIGRASVDGTRAVTGRLGTLGARARADRVDQPDRADPADRVDRVGVLVAAAGMIFVHVALLPLYLLLESGADRWVMAGLSALGVGVLAWLTWAVRSDRLPPARLPLALAVVMADGAVTALVHLAVSGHPEHTVSVVLVVVAGGALLRSRRAVALLVGTACAAWSVIAASGRLGPPAQLAQFGAALGMAVVLAVVVFRVRADTEHRLAGARDDLTAQIQRVQDNEQVLVESERRFRGVFTGSPVGISLADENGLFADVNDAMCTLFGRPREEILGRSAREFTHPEDRDQHDGIPTLMITADHHVAHLEARYVRPDGSVRWAWLTLADTVGPAGEHWTLAHAQDVTERRLAEVALRESEAGLAAVTEVMRAAQGGTDPRPVLVGQLRRLAGAATVTLIERRGCDLMVTAAAGLDMIGLRVSMDAPSATVSVWRSGRTLFIADPAASPLVNPGLVALSGARSMLWQPILDGDAVIAVLSVAWTHRVEGLSDRAAQAVALLALEGSRALREADRRAQLESDALTDPLTGLPNRRAWDIELGLAMAEAALTLAPMTVALVDLDHFKAYNDRYGHQAGDRLLVEFAATATTAVRAVDIVARWGGEEFGVLLPGCPADAAHAVLDRLRTAVPGGQHASIGYCTWNGTDTVGEVTRRADQALYVAKSSGRNTVTSS